MPIRTHSGEAFRNSYIQREARADDLLKANFGQFFIIPLEEMTRLMKLPVPPNRVSNHTLIFLTGGETTLNSGSETYRVLPNECLIVPAGQVFSFDRVEPNTGYLCSIHPDFMVGKFGSAELLSQFEFLRVWGNPHSCPDEQTACFVTQLLNRMFLRYSAHGLVQPDLIQSYFIALLCELNGVYKPASGSGQTNAVSITNRFRELLFERVKTHQLVSEYAALLHITPNHLNKSVKAVTGQSPTKWIDEAIVLEAKVLLHQTTLSVNEVANEVGITDASYFSRLFRKYAGVTPVGFRRLIETS